jgi:undecaprenyl-phosphate 4-deoxy-4-formamido-L-arabinose transferase
LIVGGIMLCALGIIGEYIGRMYLCMNRTPQYVIKETVGNSDSLNKF